MSKKSKPAKHKKNLSTSISQADRWLGLISQQMLAGDYTDVVTNCKRFLNYLPQTSPLRVHVLGQLGTANAMLQNFAKSYAALTQALELAANDADLWYNRGLASRFTCRFGRSFLDFERAAELNTISEL